MTTLKQLFSLPELEIVQIDGDAVLSHSIEEHTLEIELYGNHVSQELISLPLESKVTETELWGTYHIDTGVMVYEALIGRFNPLTKQEFDSLN